jgi:hypothetical protein
MKLIETRELNSYVLRKRDLFLIGTGEKSWEADTWSRYVTIDT